MTTESAIFTNPHHSMLTALTTGDSDDSRLVAPRAISAPGTTTTAAPYAADTRADAPADESRHRHGDGAEQPACAAITRQGESTGWSRRKASASARVIGLKAA